MLQNSASPVFGVKMEKDLSKLTFWQLKNSLFLMKQNREQYKIRILSKQLISVYSAVKIFLCRSIIPSQK